MMKGVSVTAECDAVDGTFFSLDKLNNLQEVGDGASQGPRKSEKDV